jgi:hypothetical protein
MLNLPFLTGISWAAAAVVLAILAAFFVPYLRSLLAEGEYTDLLELVDKTVKAAEQIFSSIPKSGADKKNWVLEQLKNLGIDTGKNIMNTLIEALRLSI